MTKMRLMRSNECSFICDLAFCHFQGIACLFLILTSVMTSEAIRAILYGSTIVLFDGL